MASEVTLQTRRVSGTGVLRIPTENKVYRLYTLHTQVLRNPTSPYLNMKSNPPEGFFARITCVNDDVVYQTFDVKYKDQAFDFNADITAEVLTAVKCAYKGTLQTFINLGAALGIPPISVEDKIAPYNPLELPFNEFRIVCYSTAAINLTLKAIAIDTCDPLYEQPQKRPTPPPKKPTVPPNTPLEIDPPYTDDPVSNMADLDRQYTPPPTGSGWCVRGRNLAAPNNAPLTARYYRQEPKITYNSTPADEAYWGFKYVTFNDGASFVTGTYSIQKSDENVCTI